MCVQRNGGQKIHLSFKTEHTVFHDERTGLDLVLHSDFWLSNNPQFEDRSTKGGDTAAMNGCPVQCPRCQKDNKAVYCLGLADHKVPITREAHGVSSSGYVAPQHLGEIVAGHHFSCEQHTGNNQCSKKANKKSCEEVCVNSFGHAGPCECRQSHFVECSVPPSLHEQVHTRILVAVFAGWEPYMQV